MDAKEHIKEAEACIELTQALAGEGRLSATDCTAILGRGQLHAQIAQAISLNEINQRESDRDSRRVRDGQ